MQLVIVIWGIVMISFGIGTGCLAIGFLFGKKSNIVMDDQLSTNNKEDILKKYEAALHKYKSVLIKYEEDLIKIQKVLEKVIDEVELNGFKPIKKDPQIN